MARVPVERGGTPTHPLGAGGARPRARRGRLLGAGAALAASAAAAALWAGPACACGGTAWYLIGAAFAPPADLVDFGGPAGSAEEAGHAFEYSFLAPFTYAEPGDARGARDARALRALWDARTGSERALDGGGACADGVAPLTPDALGAALRAGDAARAEREARLVAAEALDRPALFAQCDQPAVRRAVEYLELRGHLAGVAPDAAARFFTSAEPPAADTAARARWTAAERAGAAALPPALAEAARLRGLPRAELARLAERLPTSPRRPSLRYVALHERSRRAGGDGWEPDTSAAARAEWRALDVAYDRWLADHPGHPLADLARLDKLRVYQHLPDDGGRSAALLAAMYPRHPARVLAELRHLRRVDRPLDSAVARRVADPRLRSAAVRADAPVADWAAEWRLAERALPARWAVNMQERLLRAALADTARAGLPPGFPARAAAPTPLWGTLRLALLVRAGRWDDAAAQARLLPPGQGVAGFRAQLALRARRWTEAVAQPELHPDARRYLVRVLAPDTALAALSATADTAARAEALRTRAARRAAGGDWAGAAALVAPADPERAGRLRRAGALATDTTARGRVAFARYLAACAADSVLLLEADDRAWYRALDDRAATVAAVLDTARGAPPAVPGLDVPWTLREEGAAIRRHLLGTSELYLALRAYAAALPALPPAEARAAAREADGVYNRLYNRNYEYTRFWRRTLRGSAEAAVIRRAGRGP